EATRAGGRTATPVARECTFAGFMKCDPIRFKQRIKELLKATKGDRKTIIKYNQRRQDGAREMTAAQSNVVDQGEPAPKCNRCGLCHFGNYPAKCTKCNKMGHKAKDCRVEGMATGLNALPIRACYKTFDVIIGMDWLVKHDALIVYGKKEVHIPVKGKTLVIKGNCDVSRLKVVSCIKERKYIERGCHLFITYVAEKEPKEKHLEDVHIIHDFPEVFLDDLPGLPPPR
nr:reverse transcriptase domain-containing protein [Tanacetum cinerariifolium]